MFEIPERTHGFIAIILVLVYYGCFDVMAEDWNRTDMIIMNGVWIGAVLICFPRITATISTLDVTTPRSIRRLGWFTLIVTFIMGSLASLAKSGWSL